MNKKTHWEHIYETKAPNSLWNGAKVHLLLLPQGVNK